MIKWDLSLGMQVCFEICKMTDVIPNINRMKEKSYDHSIDAEKF